MTGAFLPESILLDVSALTPPEPLEKILSTLDQLKRGAYLCVLHNKDPFLLYPFLTERGFSHHVRPGKDTEFEILIWHKDDIEIGNMFR